MEPGGNQRQPPLAVVRWSKQRKNLRLQRERARFRSNNGEREIISELTGKGWQVHTRGWPDIVAVKGSAIRFIEVKPCGRYPSAAQRALFDVLARYCGISVELKWPVAHGNTKREVLVQQHASQLKEKLAKVRGEG